MPSINPAEAFVGGIKRPGVGFFYTLGLLGVTFVMTLLPLIYLSLIALVAYGTFYHATHNYSWVTGGLGHIPRVWLLKFFVFVTPIFMGLIMTVFMVKPFFARAINNHQPYALNPASEPILYNFIVRVCNIVGAPIPSLIELDSEINASAGLRYGFRSFFSNDLVLAIGLPLVAGLTVREFAGVLAHEFGHFTQGAAMRLHYIVNRIDRWFGRVIWERDSWDAWLSEMTEDEEGGWITVMAAFAQFGVWLSRQVLKALLIFGHAFSCYLSRRMEFHADQFQISVAGSEAFESTKQRVNTLSFLHQVGLHQMQVTWNLNKRLPDNLPQFILNMEDTQTGAHVRKAIKGDLGFVKTGLFHTHPSDADRVRAARLAHAPGVIAVDAPATELFENFPVPARIVTTLFYEGIGLPLGLAKLYEVEVAQPKSAELRAETPDSPEAAVDRYFSGVVTPLRPIFPNMGAKIDDSQISELIKEIDIVPAQISAVSEQVAQACADFDSADKMMLAASQEDTGMAEGVDVATWRLQREQARRSLQSVFELYSNRLTAALCLIETSTFHQTSPNAADMRRRATAPIQILLKLQPLLKMADSLRVTAAALGRERGNEAAALARLQEEIADIEAAMRDVPCPDDIAKGSTLYQYYRALPVAQDPFLITRAEALSALPMSLYTRLLGDLVVLAERTVEHLSAQPAPHQQPA
jgi:Zn-dependent protease with chaperone function